MTSRIRKAGIAIGVILGIAAIVFVFVTPYNRMPGVRLAGVETSAPNDWTTVNNAR